jgi:hypothetical protein
MFEVGAQGLDSTYWNQPFDGMAPWHRCVSKKDPRLFPIKGGGRRMRHPFLAHIVYPRVPDRTTNFLDDRLRHVQAAVTKTIASSAVTKFSDSPEDVVIREVWQARSLSTFTELFRQFYAYLHFQLPPGRYIGWQPRDLTHKNYFVTLLDVQVGEPDHYVVEELGDSRPYYMREQLTVTFKLVREVFAPAGVVVAVGR